MSQVIAPEFVDGEDDVERDAIALAAKLTRLFYAPVRPVLEPVAPPPAAPGAAAPLSDCR